MPHLGYHLYFFRGRIADAEGRVSSSNAHSLSLRRGTGSDLLDTELGELGLQLLELLGKVFLALSPELTSLDLGCRLKFISITNPQRLRKKARIEKLRIQHTMVGGFVSCRTGIVDNED
jgi:hypothetical protein